MSKNKYNELKEKGITHVKQEYTRKARGKEYIANRYYNILTRTSHSIGQLNNDDKVFCPKENRVFSPAEITNMKKNKNNTRSIQKLLDQGYTHKRYTGRNYINLTTKKPATLSRLDKENVKIYCQETNQDITKECFQRLHQITRLNNIETNQEELKQDNDSLKEQGYTHKRYKNRKIYDLINSRYVSLKEMVETNFKIFSSIHNCDITKCFDTND